mmetsp:Transcript_1864/g.4593  ORF Transcript_1864/g.4593 Transcript_1864/m.4593 type:complete len:286 (+) Transcript_1864:1026-1883(+)
MVHVVLHLLLLLLLLLMVLLLLLPHRHLLGMEFLLCLGPCFGFLPPLGDGNLVLSAIGLFPIHVRLALFDAGGSPHLPQYARDFRVLDVGVLVLDCLSSPLAEVQECRHRPLRGGGILPGPLPRNLPRPCVRRLFRHVPLLVLRCDAIPMRPLFLRHKLPQLAGLARDVGYGGRATEHFLDLGLLAHEEHDVAAFESLRCLGGLAQYRPIPLTAVLALRRGFCRCGRNLHIRRRFYRCIGIWFNMIIIMMVGKDERVVHSVRGNFVRRIVVVVMIIIIIEHIHWS